MMQTLKSPPLPEGRVCNHNFDFDHNFLWIILNIHNDMLGLGGHDYHG